MEHGSTSPPSHTQEDAVEHTGPDVCVTVGPLDEGSGFYVADDGDGIPECDREEVFQSGITTKESGTGLGLSIVEHVATAHDWDVTVTESDSQGARFEFRERVSASPVDRR